MHFEDRKYNDYEVILWDYNQQQPLEWGGSWSLSHPEKHISFPVTVTPVDGITIFERLKQFQNVQEENK